jgi:hypothetical protein
MSKARLRGYGEHDRELYVREEGGRRERERRQKT